MVRGDEHIRGTPIHTGSPLRLALVLVSLFLAFPALLAPVVKIDDAFPGWLRLLLITSGASSWAVASFMSSPAWFSLSLSAAVAQGLFITSQHGLVDEALVERASLPLLASGVIAAPAFASLDLTVLVGVLAAAWSVSTDASVELKAVIALGVGSLILSPGVIGIEATKAFSPISTNLFLLPAAGLSVFLAVYRGNVPEVVVASIAAALVLSAYLCNGKPEPTKAADAKWRSSHWLFVGLAASLTVVGMREGTGPSHALSALTLLLSGASASVVVTSLLGWTARVWGPVRSGEFQMVTLDFLALLAYFVSPLLYVLYLAWDKYAAALAFPPIQAPFNVPAQLVAASPWAQAATLALLLAAAQAAFLASASSVVWAHWLIPTFTLGALDTRKVAFVVRFSDLLKNSCARDLALELESSGLKPLNIFASSSDAIVHGTLLKSLQSAGHVIGAETAAGPFVGPRQAAKAVADTLTALREKAYLPPAQYYMSADGYVSPWAMVAAAARGAQLVAPANWVQLGDNAGLELRRVLDPWFRGGVVMVDVSRRGKINVHATLKDLAQHTQAGKYKAAALPEVCQRVQEMRLVNLQ